MTPTEIVNHLSEVNPEALLLEPRSVFDDALIGYQEREGMVVAVYDIDALVELASEVTGSNDWIENADHVSFNITGSWMGPGTPEFQHGGEE